MNSLTIMDIIALKISILLIFALFFVPKKWRYNFSLFLHLIIISITSIWAIQALFFVDVVDKSFMWFIDKQLHFQIDYLSAFFIIVINLTITTGILYAKGYLKPYESKKSNIEMSWHFINFLWLHVSMLFVVMFRDFLAFLVVWEIMSLSSFFLVIFESEKKETIKTGIKYLLQMHIGVALLMVAFIIAAVKGGGGFNFESLTAYFANHDSLPLFILFFIGFGIKAGFVPLHSWLPHAHPAAPSHVSGVMSGVMIKIGIYGILRVLTYVHSELYNIGIFILVISLATGIIGISLAIVQREIKKILAYSSIENIGIIGIGIGLGTIGLAENIAALTIFGFGGSLLHILNHSIFKSLLFYNAGSIYQQTHTLNIEFLGGLIRKMPKTAIFFLIATLAICGLPPFNGFISEFLIYSAMFKSLHAADLFTDIVLLAGFSGLAVIGGLAIFCFTKVFGVVFLGTARSEKTSSVCEPSSEMLFPKYISAFMIILIGLVPAIFINSVAKIVTVFSCDVAEFQHIIPVMNNISLASLVLIFVIAVLWFLRNWQQKKQLVTENTTWGCGYSAAKASVHQYTSASFADNFVQLTTKLTNVKKTYTEIKEEEIFPAPRSFKTESDDIFENNLINRPANKIIYWSEKIAVLQTGRIQSYLLYALLFLGLVFFLSYFDLL